MNWKNDRGEFFENQKIIRQYFMTTVTNSNVLERYNMLIRNIIDSKTETDYFYYKGCMSEFLFWAKNLFSELDPVETIEEDHSEKNSYIMKKLKEQRDKDYGKNI